MYSIKIKKAFKQHLSNDVFANQILFDTRDNLIDGIRTKAKEMFTSPSLIDDVHGIIDNNKSKSTMIKKLSMFFAIQSFPRTQMTRHHHRIIPLCRGYFKSMRPLDGYAQRYKGICDDFGVEYFTIGSEPQPTPEPTPEQTPDTTPEPKSATEYVTASDIPTGDDGDQGWKFMAEKIAPFVKPDASHVADTINKIVTDAINNMPARRVEITFDGIETKDVGIQHFAFEKLLRNVTARVNTYMVGPAGSGKTTAAEKVAETLNLAFYTMSVGLQTTKSDIFGYRDANGNYNRTLFRDAYEHGGVFLFDEIDAGHAGVLTAINSATANGACAFPDGMVKRHDDFVCLAAGNTFGRGADADYVGRQKLDKATLDRFASLVWDYDENLEREISGNVEWTTEVQKIRAAVNKAKVRLIVSPRASIMGAKMLAAGVTRDEVMEQLIWKGCSTEERNRVNEQLK